MENNESADGQIFTGASTPDDQLSDKKTSLVLKSSFGSPRGSYHHCTSKFYYSPNEAGKNRSSSERIGTTPIPDLLSYGRRWKASEKH